MIFPFALCSLILAMVNCILADTPPAVASDGTLKLMNVTKNKGLVSGLVQFYDDDWVKEDWSSICTSKWTLKDTMVACRQLGYQSAKEFSYKNATKVFIDGISCDGNENKISSCKEGDSYRLRESCTYAIPYITCFYQPPSNVMLPDLPSKFQVHIVGTNVAAKRSFYAQEVYDQTLKKGVIKVKGANMKYSLMYDFNQNRALKIDGNGNCKETDITESGAFVFEDSHHMSLGGMLGVFPEMKQVEEANVDGIQCNVFRGENIFESSFHANGTVELYWSKPGASDFANCPKLETACLNWTVPIQLKVSGTNVKTNGTYNLIYRFYDFQYHIDELETFEIPPGTLCTNLKNNPKFPYMEADYYTGIEIVKKGIDIINLEVYVRRERFREALRVDCDSSDFFGLNGASLETTNYQTFILDERQGVYYKIDRRAGTCQVFSEMQIVNDFQDDLELLLNFLMGDNNLNYTYMGLRMNRNQLSEVWATLGIQKKTLNEFYFVKGQRRSADKEETQQMNVPVTINVSDYSTIGDQIKIGNSSQYNFYNFYAYSPPWTEFDISSCYPRQLSSRIQLKFRRMGVNSDPLDGKEEIFQEALTTYLKNEYQISPIRFQQIKTDFVENGDIYFMATLLEDPQIAGFAKNIVFDPERSNEDFYNFMEEMSLENTSIIVLEVPGVLNLSLVLEEIRRMI